MTEEVYKQLFQNGYRKGNFMAIYRCAVCGSSKVVAETKQEGYNKNKGIFGMALFGLGGAVAGASGNTVIYYHCADCGHTLNRCMSGVDKEFLEKYLLEPTNAAYVNRLREYKKQYPNIEWEEPTKEENNSIKISVQNNYEKNKEEHKQQAEEIQQIREKYAKELEEIRQQKIPIEMAILNALYKTEKPCTILDMQKIELSCMIYSNQQLSATTRRLVEKNIIEKSIENCKAYFKAIPNSKDEAIKMLSML